MKTLLKIIAATAAMAGICLLVYELFRRWDENGRRCSDGTLKHFLDSDRRKKDDDYDTIADYRYDDDDDLFDDDFFADLDGVSHKVEVEIEEDACEQPEMAADSADEAADEDEPAVTFDLSEDALEQLLDN